MSQRSNAQRNKRAQVAIGYLVYCTLCQVAAFIATMPLARWASGVTEGDPRGDSALFASGSEALLLALTADSGAAGTLLGRMVVGAGAAMLLAAIARVYLFEALASAAHAGKWRALRRVLRGIWLQVCFGALELGVVVLGALVLARLATAAAPRAIVLALCAVGLVFACVLQAIIALRDAATALGYAARAQQALLARVAFVRGIATATFRARCTCTALCLPLIVAAGWAASYVGPSSSTYALLAWLASNILVSAARLIDATHVQTALNAAERQALDS
jgi:hypothetical protein